MPKKQLKSKSAIITLFLAIILVFGTSYFSKNRIGESSKTPSEIKIVGEEVVRKSASAPTEQIIPATTLSSNVAGMKTLSPEEVAALQPKISPEMEEQLKAQMQAQINAPVPPLPEDLQKQLNSPTAELPADLQAQVENQEAAVPDDIKNALTVPPKIVSIEEVNTPKSN